MATRPGMAEYMRDRRATRRKEMLALLGGVCVRCGTTEELEFDHIDPATKKFTIASGLDGNWDVLLLEVRKCQLLCASCHAQKSIENGDINIVPHGGGACGKYRCQCEPCRARKAEYMKAYGHPNR